MLFNSLPINLSFPFLTKQQTGGIKAAELEVTTTITPEDFTVYVTLCRSLSTDHLLLLKTSQGGRYYLHFIDEKRGIK